MTRLRSYLDFRETNNHAVQWCAQYCFPKIYVGSPVPMSKGEVSTIEQFKLDFDLLFSDGQISK